MKLVGILLVTSFAMANATFGLLKEFAFSNRKFACNMHRKISWKRHSENFVFSPFSVQAMLSLTRAGCSGRTKDQITSVLGLPSETVTEEAFRTLIPAFQARRGRRILRPAIRIFSSHKSRISRHFQTLAGRIFGTGIDQVDYSQPQTATQFVNNWFGGRTNRRVSNIISPDIVSGVPASSLLLINAFYLSAPWKFPFPIGLTKRELFYLSRTRSQHVNMMRLVETFRYRDCRECNAHIIEIPFSDGDCTMVIASPYDREGLSILERNMEHVLVEDSWENRLLDIRLPKFSIDCHYYLKDILKELGLEFLFSNSADLRGMFEDNAQISKVVHKAVINVGESGIEVTETTVVDTKTYISRADRAHVFTIDHPFCYFIKYKEIVLFSGRIVKF